MFHPPRHSTVAALAVATAIAMSASPAPAQDDEQSKKAARQFLSEGDRHLSKGDSYDRRGKQDKSVAEYEQALDAYQQAYEAFPQPQIFFAIGQAEEKLGRFYDAYGHYKTLLEETTDLSDKLRAAVELRIDSIMGELGLIVLEVKPDRSAIEIDGNKIGTSPLVEPLVLPPGPHKLVARLKGHTPKETEIIAEAGGKVVVKVKLELLPEVVEDVRPDDSRIRQNIEPPPAPGKGILIAGLAVTGVAGATASVTGILALSRHGTFSDDALPIADRESARDSGRTLSIVTDVFLGVTVSAAAFSAYYYYAVYRPRQRELISGPEKAVFLSPYAGPDGGGLAVLGRF